MDDYWEGQKILEIRFTEGICPNLEILSISDCDDDLVKVETLLNTLQQLSFQGCSNLRKIKRHGCPKRYLLIGAENWSRYQDLDAKTASLPIFFLN